ncbi:MAG: polysaccharide deacetylase family protein [Defluviitaleaceae bacterium]|nr:polysaccharide deacetylase family protein [Defluviitaleaceae bacterium]
MLYLILGIMITMTSVVNTPEEVPINEPQKLVALTFDDGPGPYTDRLLDFFSEHNVVATFYVMGSSIQRRPETLIRTARLGHEIGNHSWLHENLTEVGTRKALNTMRRTSDIILELTGERPRTARPPYGATDERVQNILRILGNPIVLWSVDTRDWETREVEAIYNHIINGAENGAIILMHDIHRTTYEAVKKAVPSLIEMGFGFATVSEILGEMEPGEIYRRGR